MCDIFTYVNTVKISNSVKIDTFSGCNDTVHSAMEMKEKTKVLTLALNILLV